MTNWYTVTHEHNTVLDYEHVWFCVSEEKDPDSLTCVTVNVVAVIEVFIIEGRTGGHQLLQPHLSDEEAAGQVEMLQNRKPSALRQSPESYTHTHTHTAQCNLITVHKNWSSCLNYKASLSLITWAKVSTNGDVTWWAFWQEPNHFELANKNLPISVFHKCICDAY